MNAVAVDYDRGGDGYALQRQTDPEIAAQIEAALGDSRTVVNVGAGTGSYEPIDRQVLAVEPSSVMRAQRGRELAPAIACRAEALPLDDRSVDAAMALLTVHHWGDAERGLRELRRVARGPVVVLTYQAAIKARFWLFTDYLPEGSADDRARFPALAAITKALGTAQIEAVPIPADCRDGFTEAFYGRPESFLDSAVRAAQSVWGRLSPAVQRRAIESLRADLDQGVWDNLHGQLRAEPFFDGGLRLIVSSPS